VPDPSRLALFVGAALLLLVVPGPSVLYIVTQSVSHGRRAGIASVAGITTGTLVHIAAATVGLSALLASSAVAFDVVKYLGAAYLIVVGIRRLAGWEREQEPWAGEPRDLGRLYRQGIVVNTLNPKTALFFLAFLPQFTKPENGSLPLQLVALGGIFILSTLLVFGAISLLAGVMGQWLRRSERAQKILNKTAGAIFAGLALKLATASR
jgi:threonine/homoserine/homoserine lactone efflux protein